MEEKPVGPVLGDIIVRKHHASGECYVLMPFQQASQVAYQFYAEAVKHALDFAAKHRVAAWYTEDARSYRRLELHPTWTQGKRSTRKAEGTAGD